MGTTHTNPLGVCVWEGRVEGVGGIDGMGGVCQQIPTDLDSHHTRSVGEGEEEEEGGEEWVDSDLAHAGTHTHAHVAMSAVKNTQTNKRTLVHTDSHLKHTQTHSGRESSDGGMDGRGGREIDTHLTDIGTDGLRDGGSDRLV